MVLAAQRGGTAGDDARGHACGAWRYRLDVVNVDTTQDYVPQLIGFFRRRDRAAR